MYPYNINEQQIIKLINSGALDELCSSNNLYIYKSDYHLIKLDIDERIVKAYTYDRLVYLLNTILLGCAVNELEMFAYSTDFDQTTLEQKWSDLLDKYGATLGRNKFDYLYEVVLTHNVYYISYAVSGIAVLEMFQKTYDNFEKAKTIYESICTKDSNDEKFLKSVGLTDDILYDESRVLYELSSSEYSLYAILFSTLNPDASLSFCIYSSLALSRLVLASSYSFSASSNSIL